MNEKKEIKQETRDLSSERDFYTQPAKEAQSIRTRMDGPTFRALKEYFDEWGDKDPTLFRKVN